MCVIVFDLYLLCVRIGEISHGSNRNCTHVPRTYNLYTRKQGSVKICHYVCFLANFCIIITRVYSYTEGIEMCMFIRLTTCPCIRSSFQRVYLIFLKILELLTLPLKPRMCNAINCKL